MKTGYKFFLKRKGNLMKIINVNKLCRIDQTNIAKAKHLDVAVSVTSMDDINGNESGFINFTFGIEPIPFVCEYAGTFLIKEKEEDLYYVDRIEFDIDLTENELKILNKNLEDEYENPDTKCAKIYDKKGLIATAIVFNQHIGNYSHYIQALKNGDLIYEKLL